MILLSIISRFLFLKHKIQEISLFIHLKRNGATDYWGFISQIMHSFDSYVFKGDRLIATNLGDRFANQINGNILVVN